MWLIAAVRTLPEGWNVLVALEIAVVGAASEMQTNHYVADWDRR